MVSTRYEHRPLPCPSAATRRSSSIVVGSSPMTSSPTTASAIARRIAAVGLVTVSLPQVYVGVRHHLSREAVARAQCTGQARRHQRPFGASLNNPDKARIRSAKYPVARREPRAHASRSRAAHLKSRPVRAGPCRRRPWRRPHRCSVLRPYLPDADPGDALRLLGAVEGSVHVPALFPRAGEQRSNRREIALGIMARNGGHGRGGRGSRWNAERSLRSSKQARASLVSQLSDASISSIAVAAHEVGHVLQHAQGYARSSSARSSLRWRASAACWLSLSSSSGSSSTYRASPER
jgi:hypothetical protein